jgi:hypothetical protein
MPRHRALVVTVVLAARAALAGSDASSNPLLAPWSGPYGGVPPFDRVKIEHFQPVLEAGMEAYRKEIAAIVASPDAPTFENTIAAYIRSRVTAPSAAATPPSTRSCASAALLSPPGADPGCCRP